MLKFQILNIKQLYGRLLGFGKVFRFRKVGAGACTFFCSSGSSSTTIVVRGPGSAALVYITIDNIRV